jgi:hypothetical protein
VDVPVPLYLGLVGACSCRCLVLGHDWGLVTTWTILFFFEGLSVQIWTESPISGSWNSEIPPSLTRTSAKRLVSPEHPIQAVWCLLPIQAVGCRSQSNVFSWLTAPSRERETPAAETANNHRDSHSYRQRGTLTEDTADDDQQPPKVESSLASLLNLR